MKHADAERVIKDSFHWEMIKIRLHNVQICGPACCCERRFDCVTQINADNIARAPTRCEPRVTPLATTAFKDQLVFEEIRLNRLQPAEQCSP